MGEKQASAQPPAFAARASIARIEIVSETAKNQAKANRERRLGAALRENLKRRKAQAKARSSDRAKPTAAPAHDSAGISEKDKKEESWD